MVWICEVCSESRVLEHRVLGLGPPPTGGDFHVDLPPAPLPEAVVLEDDDERNLVAPPPPDDDDFDHRGGSKRSKKSKKSWKRSKKDGRRPAKRQRLDPEEEAVLAEELVPAPPPIDVFFVGDVMLRSVPVHASSHPEPVSSTGKTSILLPPPPPSTTVKRKKKKRQRESSDEGEGEDYEGLSSQPSNNVRVRPAVVVAELPSAPPFNVEMIPAAVARTIPEILVPQALAPPKPVVALSEFEPLPALAAAAVGRSLANPPSPPPSPKAKLPKAPRDPDAPKRPRKAPSEEVLFRRRERIKRPFNSTQETLVPYVDSRTGLPSMSLNDLPEANWPVFGFIGDRRTRVTAKCVLHEKNKHSCYCPLDWTCNSRICNCQSRLWTDSFEGMLEKQTFTPIAEARRRMAELENHRGRPSKRPEKSAKTEAKSPKAKPADAGSPTNKGAAGQIAAEIAEVSVDEALVPPPPPPPPEDSTNTDEGSSKARDALTTPAVAYRGRNGRRGATLKVPLSPERDQVTGSVTPPTSSSSNGRNLRLVEHLKETQGSKVDDLKEGSKVETGSRRSTKRVLT